MKRRDFIKVMGFGSAFWGSFHTQTTIGHSTQSTSRALIPDGETKGSTTLEFKNSGIVRKEMQFQYFDQPVAYAEDLEHWNTRGTAKYLYLVDDDMKMDPPVGMRSAVPLGGLGSGTLELRADGSFRDWNIFNNSPAGGPKVQVDDTFFGLWLEQGSGQPRAWTLRSHPPQGLPPVSQIEYSGAFPVSRLCFSDPDLPIAVDLHAYSEFHPRDAEASATPAAIFTFNLHNLSAKPAEVSLLFVLRNYTGGRATGGGNQIGFQRDGRQPTSGSIVAKAAAQAISTTNASGSDRATIWEEFSAAGEFRDQHASESAPQYSALAAKTTLKAGESRTITFVLAWYFPHRPFKSRSPGNYYTALYRNAGDIAEKVVGRLESTWDAICNWQRSIFNNSLPDWLQDALVNSVATMYKTGLWFEDSRWRQWESFSCAGLNPVHIDFYRVLPYAFFFPELNKQLHNSHAQSQQADGFIPEQLTTGCFKPESELGEPGGREMGDSATNFILWAWQIYSWTADKQYVDSIWMNVKKAAGWQMRKCEAFGLPQRLNNTYDWWEFEKRDLVSYNAFLHLAAMLAAEKLAEAEGDTELARQYHKAFETGQKSLHDHLWTGEYFRSWWLDGTPYSDALHADTLYGQLWAFVLNLGLTIDQKSLKAHLDSESRLNSSQFGLKVLRRADPQNQEAENAVPHGGGLQAARDNLIWEAGSLDWCSLSLYLGGNAKQCLDEAQKVVLKWADRLRDQWNYTDLTAAWDGYPWCNSHYARQVILWSIPLALSGQHYSAPEGRLSFDPRVPPPAKLPFFTPTADGILELLGGGRYRVLMVSGELELRELRVGEASLRKQPILLQAGASVRLNPD